LTTSSLKGKVVVITGASSGIGEAAAYAFSALGCKLMLAARNESELNRVAAGCSSETSFCVTDVSKESDCKNLIDFTIQTFGGIDVLINNAGISMRAVFSETDLSVIERLMQVNFWGTVYCTRFAIASIIERKGSVIAVSSVAGIKGLPGRTGYSASKFAMQGFMESLRIENLKKGIHVGVILPGYTASNIRNTALNKEGKSQSDTPLDESKLMPASQVADEIVKMVLQRKAEVVLTTQGKLTKWLNKFFPRLVDQLVYKTVSKEKDSPF